MGGRVAFVREALCSCVLWGGDRRQRVDRLFAFMPIAHNTSGMRDFPAVEGSRRTSALH
jgi:hypothetical protein